MGEQHSRDSQPRYCSASALSCEIVNVGWKRAKSGGIGSRGAGWLRRTPTAAKEAKDASYKAAKEAVDPAKEVKAAEKTGPQRLHGG